MYCTAGWGSVFGGTNGTDHQAPYDKGHLFPIYFVVTVKLMGNCIIKKENGD